MIPYSLNPMGIDRIAELTDLDILRQIRDANPTSQLPSLWLDSEDPYTQWEGVTWNAEKTRVIQLNVNSRHVSTLQNVNKLTSLQYLDCYYNQLTELNVAGLTSLQILYCYYNQLTALNVAGLTALQYLDCYYNQLTALPTLTSKGLINYYNFVRNNFPTAELDRLRAMGFTEESRLLPQNP